VQYRHEVFGWSCERAKCLGLVLGKWVLEKCSLAVGLGNFRCINAQIENTLFTCKLDVREQNKRQNIYEVVKNAK